MIRAIRPTATADAPVEWLRGWNVAPNDDYQVDVTPSAATVGVILSRGGVIVATGGCLPGTDQPVMLAPAPGQTLDRIDADLPWHLLISSPAGPASVTLAAMVDLPDEIHPIYQSDTLALSRATGLIDHGTHITADITVTCPLGLGAGLGAVVAVPVDGEDVAGQVESINWTATPDGAIEQAVIRKHIPIAPTAQTTPVPPAVADDTGATDAATTTSGNVLGNDDPGLSVVAVNGLSARVGQIVAGSNGGDFLIAATGAWTFDPAGDFSGLTGSDTATTSVTYHASDGTSEAMGTLTVTVSSADAQPWTPAAITTAIWLDAADSSTITLNGSTVSEWRDKSGNARHATQGVAASQPTLNEKFITFDGSNDFLACPAFTLSQPTSLFLVARVHTLAGERTIINQQYGDTARPWQHYVNASGQLRDWRVNSYVSGITANTWFQAGQIQSATNVVDAWRDGVTGTRGTMGTAYPSNVAIYIGKEQSFGPLGWMDGDFAEMILVLGAVDTASRQRIEGYLAHKWGLVDSIPADHPYKTAAPIL